jgi:hypothetical protein
MTDTRQLAHASGPAALPTGPGAVRGLLITPDAGLARAFQRELERCADCPAAFDVQPSLRDAERAAPGPFSCVTIDLDGALPPADAVRRARARWPGARVAVLSYWWSERDTDARGLADLVIHKPVREPELLAFLRSPIIVSGAERPQPVAGDGGARLAG